MAFNDYCGVGIAYNAKIGGMSYSSLNHGSFDFYIFLWLFFSSIKGNIGQIVNVLNCINFSL